MTITQIVEEALRAYQPPCDNSKHEGLIREGRLLVLKGSGDVISEAIAQEAIDLVRLSRP